MKKSPFAVAVTWIIGIALTVLLIPAYSLADGVEQVDRPTWNVGDVRTFQVLIGNEKTIEVETVTEVSKDGYIVAADRNGKKTIEIYSLDLILVKKMDEAGKTIDWYDTGITKIKWPLKAGTTWSENHVASNKNLGSLTQIIDAEINAETILIGGKETSTVKIVTKRKGKANNYIDKLERWYSSDLGCFARSKTTRISGSTNAKDYDKELISFAPGKK